MPYDPNANWTARTDAAAKSPIYYIEIDGLTTKHFSTGPVRSPAVTKKVLLRVREAVGQKLKQLQGKATLSLVSLELLDKDGEITDLISTDKASPTLPSLINRKVTLRSGYVDLAESDYAVIGVGQVSDVVLSERNTSYLMKMVDFKRHQQDQVFRNAEAGSTPYNAILAAQAQIGDRSLSIVGTTEGLSIGDKLFVGPSATGFEEKVEIAALGTNSITIKDPIVGLHSANEAVRWATTIVQANPIDLLFNILNGSFTLAQFGPQFPILKKRGLPTGLGINVANLDSTEIQKERDQMWPDEVWEVEATQPLPGWELLEETFYRFLGYPKVKIDGRLSFRAYRPEYPDVVVAGLPTIVRNDVKRWAWRRALELHVNRVVLGVDYDLGAGRAAQIVVSEDLTDQTNSKEIAEMKQDQTGLRTALRGVRIGENVASLILRRFLKPPVQLELACHLTRRALEIGEVVSFTHSQVPNVKTGLLGMTAERLEIVERTENLEREEVVFVLQDAGFVRPAAIALDGQQSDYDSATAAEKEYAYIAPDAGNFADGGLPYEIV